MDASAAFVFSVSTAHLPGCFNIQFDDFGFHDIIYCTIKLKFNCLLQNIGKIINPISLTIFP